jgi:hypothetical protein
LSKREKSVCEPECCHQNKKEKSIQERKKEILMKSRKEKMKGRKNI